MRVLDLVEGDDQRVLVGEQRARVGVGVGVDLGDDALVLGRAGEPFELLGRVFGASQTLWTLRRPRFASATACDRRRCSLSRTLAARTSRAPSARVADLPALGGELVADLIGAREVLVGAGPLALGEQLLGLGIGGVGLGQQRVEPEQRQQLLERRPGAGQLAPVALGDQLEQGREGLGRVEVVGERVEEGLALFRDERVGLAAGASRR